MAIEEVHPRIYKIPSPGAPIAQWLVVGDERLLLIDSASTERSATTSRRR